MKRVRFGKVFIIISLNCDMNKSKRLFFQAILWLVIWMLLSLAQNLELLFIVESIPVYAFQIMLITILIYYAAPNFLFKKKYWSFFFISIAFILFFSLIDAFLINLFRAPPPAIMQPDRPEHLKPPILVHLTQGLLLLVAFLLALFIEGLWFLQQQERATILIKSEALQSELKLLKSQINPHFLFNALNNIYALAAFDAHKTQQSISYLSDMLRYVLYECERPFVSPQKEVKYIENYLKLFSLKSSRKYPIKMDIQITDTAVTIAPMILLPFVENALKHSYIEKTKAAFIHISLKITKEIIYFEIANSIPKTLVHKDEVGGIGLENVRKRLAILYARKHELLITETAAIFTVKLTIKPTNDA